MKQYTLVEGAIEASRLAFGCMNLNRLTDIGDREALIGSALDIGINLFDHADIYGAGNCETVFGDVLARNRGWRERMVIQSKCGIRFAGDTYDDGPPGRYDFSYQHIVRSVEGSLQRLQIDSLDVLLLHRPDLLMETDEVARAFDELSSSGKVHFFGVSNFDWGQIELLSKAVGRRLIVNQVQLSLMHCQLIAQGARINMPQAFASAVGTLDYCRLHDIRLQAWSPLAQGDLVHPPHDAPENVHHASALVHELANSYGTNPAAIVLAWLLRHPAGIQPVVGTTNIDRLRQCSEADAIELQREEWYSLLERALGQGVP
ncbi:MAG: aldo/keto reductase [Pseudomonadota bacterium]